MSMIYLDYAATAPLLDEVLEAMLPCLKEEFGNPDSLHAYGRKAADRVTDARDRIAGVLGVSPSEVYFTSGGTEADNWAVRMLGEGRVAVSAAEHAAVLEAARFRPSLLLPVTPQGAVDMTAFGHTMSEDVGLFCVMAVNNETGCIQPLEQISAAVHARGALLFSDCVQAAPSQDLAAISKLCDAFSLSAHKLGGPKGVGALIVKKGVRLAPLIAGGEQEHGLRGGTLNVSGIVGFARALELAASRRETFCAHTLALRERFEGELVRLLQGGVRIDGTHRAPNLSHVTFEKGGAWLIDRLDLEGIACSAGAACSAHAALPSHVMRAMGRSEEEARRGLRFSFGLATAEEEVLCAARTIASLLGA